MAITRFAFAAALALGLSIGSVRADNNDGDEAEFQVPTPPEPPAPDAGCAPEFSELDARFPNVRAFRDLLEQVAPDASAEQRAEWLRAIGAISLKRWNLPLSPPGGPKSSLGRQFFSDPSGSMGDVVEPSEEVRRHPLFDQFKGAEPTGRAFLNRYPFNLNPPAYPGGRDMTADTWAEVIRRHAPDASFRAANALMPFTRGEISYFRGFTDKQVRLALRPYIQQAPDALVEEIVAILTTVK
jgi:hypothetical protein